MSLSIQDSVTVSADCANGQNIRASYEISYTRSSDTSNTACVVNGTDCNNGICHHELQKNIQNRGCQPPVPQFSSGNVTVTLIAENIVGKSTPAVYRNIGEMLALYEMKFEHKVIGRT